MQVVLVMMGLGVGLIAFCRLVITVDVLHLDLVLLPSDQRCCFTPPGFSFIFMFCQFFLILLSGAPPLDSLQLVQWISPDFVASGVLIPMMTIVVLKNLCAAGIVLELGDSLYSLSTCLPGMLVVLVLISSLGVGSRAFCLVMTADVLLDLSLLSSLHQVD